MTTDSSQPTPPPEFHRILIVDDEQAICWAFTQLLRPHGYTVSVAASAEEGLELAAKENPDLVFSRDFCDSTALNWAINKNQTAIVKFLLENKADVNAGNAKMTPLHTAVVNGNKEIVELLLAKGANANIKYENKTLMQLAESYGHNDIATLLRQHGGQ